MREIRERTQGLTEGARADVELVLPFEQRQKSRLRARLENGEEVAIVLPRGTVMRNGDLLRTDDGRALRLLPKLD